MVFIFRAHATTISPWLANDRAMPVPMPDDAPVTKATCFSHLSIFADRLHVTYLQR
jgi:hypothetical protein